MIKRLNRSKCSLGRGLMGPKEPWIRWGSQLERGIFWGHLPVHCKVYSIPGIRLVFSTLFGRRQKRCGLWLAVLQQLVMTCCKIEFKRSALGLPSSCASDVPTPIYYVWTDDIYSTSNKSSTGSRWKDIKASSTGILGTSLSRSTKSWKLSFSQRTNPTH